MKKLIVLVLVSILFSCEHEDEEFNFRAYTLSGRWEWIETSGGFAGITYTPESTGQKIIVVFTIDHIYREYINNTLNIKDKFNIHADTVIFESILRKTYSINGNILTLDEGCCDLFVHKYRRINQPWFIK
jgi:hypothetical protein